MSIVVNGETMPLSEPQSLAALLAAMGPPPPFAVARNGDFVPRAGYADCCICPGDRIDIVHPTAGG